MNKTLSERIYNKIKILILCVYGFAMYPVILFQLIIIDIKKGKYSLTKKVKSYEDKKD